MTLEGDLKKKDLPLMFQKYKYLFILKTRIPLDISALSWLPFTAGCI